MTAWCTPNIDQMGPSDHFYIAKDTALSVRLSISAEGRVSVPSLVVNSDAIVGGSLTVKGAELRLHNSGRLDDEKGVARRALVDAKEVLTINQGGDYTGGVHVDSALTIKNGLTMGAAGGNHSLTVNGHGVFTNGITVTGQAKVGSLDTDSLLIAGRPLPLIPKVALKESNGKYLQVGGDEVTIVAGTSLDDKAKYEIVDCGLNTYALRSMHTHKFLHWKATRPDGKRFLRADGAAIDKYALFGMRHKGNQWMREDGTINIQLYVGSDEGGDGFIGGADGNVYVGNSGDLYLVRTF